MPIYEYRCPKCNEQKEIILPVGDRNKPQFCSCGEPMIRLMSVPQPAIFIVDNRNRLINTLNNDGEKTYALPGKAKHGQRYKQVIGNSLFNQEKKVIGRGFRGD